MMRFIFFLITCFGVFFYFIWYSQDESVVIRGNEAFDTVVFSGVESQVEFDIENTSKTDVLIVGSSPFCNDVGCISSDTIAGMVIPHGGTKRVVCKYRVNEPGSFSLILPVFFDINGIVEIGFTVAGTAQLKD